jgi:hypothetical protein
MKINVLFVNYFFREHDDYKFFRSQQSFSFTRFDEILWTSHCCDEYWLVNFFWWKFACCNEYWDELLRDYSDNVFCVVFRNVRYDLKIAIQICLLLEIVLKWFVFVIMLNHFIVNFFDRLISLLTNNVYSFSIIKWRMLVFDLSNDVCLFLINRTTFMMKRY